MRPTVEVIDLDGSSVVVASVEELPTDQKPCYVRDRGMTGGSYVRTATGDYPLTAYEVQQLLNARGQPMFDQESAEGTTLEDLDENMVAQFIERLRNQQPRVFGSSSDLEILRMARVLSDSESVVPTIAGLLALGRFPQSHPALIQVNLTLVSYPTTSGPAADGRRFLDNRTVEGPIPVIVDETIRVIARHIGRSATVAGAGRSDDYELPLEALREAIVNALVHRDLSPLARGTQVQVEIYPDRLTVRNPGGLHGPVTLDQLGEAGISSARNALLLKLMQDVQIPGEERVVCENRGSGIKAMFRAVEAAGLDPPVFEDRLSAFTVTFPNAPLLDETTRDWLASMPTDQLSTDQLKALALTNRHGAVTNLSLRASTGLDSRDASRLLGDLARQDFLIREGEGRGVRYVLGSVPTMHLQLPLDLGAWEPTGTAKQIIELLERPMTARQLAAELGISRQATYRWINELSDAGLIVGGKHGRATVWQKRG